MIMQGNIPKCKVVNTLEIREENLNGQVESLMHKAERKEVKDNDRPTHSCMIVFRNCYSSHTFF